ncbi:cell division protein FtsA [Candidatus Parcubacteria bacterium]|nr:cell division protein FtsA [Candidatus Parcubacteria bacterium]
MAKNHFITGLDIGTGSIKGLTVLKKQDSPNFEVLGRSEKFSLGIRRGVIVDPETVSKNIRWVINQLENESGQKINDVYVNLGGSHIFCTPSHGTVVVSRADQKISKEDIDRVLQSAQAFSLPLNKEIIEIFPKEFIVDGERGIKQVEGMKGVKLEVDALALCAFTPYFNNSTKAVLNSDIQIGDIFPSALASAKAVLTPHQKELGVVLIDIGAGTTSLAVFQEGNLIHTAVFPIGSAHITQDIAIGLQTDIDIAEKIKKQFGTCILNGSGSNKKEKILASQNSPLVFSRKMLTKIIEARVSEIFNLVQKEIKKITPQPLLPAGLVLTGGGAKMPRIIELAKKELKLPARRGFPQEFSEIEEDPSLSAVCGLVLEGADWSKEPGFSGFSAAGKGILGKLKKIFKVFIP